jgi:branched-chain amino acid transport system permease protein
VKAALAVLAAGVLVAVPLAGSNYVIRLATVMAMYAVLALSWNFVGGMAGYPSFATAAFFGLGAYASGVLQGRGAPMLLGWAAAALLAGLFAAALGVVLLRLRGHYFAIGSLVVAEVLRELTNSWTGLTGGGMGLNLPILRIGVTRQAQVFYASMLGLALLAVAATVLVSRGRLGFGLRTIQQNEAAAAMLGLDTTRCKTAAFALSALFAGAAGGVYASWVNYIEPADVYDVLLSVKPIVMALLGGAGTVLGPVLGAVVFLALEELVWRRFLYIHAGLLGLIIVVLVYFLPRGLLAFRRSAPTPGRA